ncbi:TolC family protein [Dokdonia sp. Hel_I_53]|uniref:TolC family protein n=1 Tax=Dokdonia sp. Hel_I_53 TaxID=1566287 RepID=UPI00119C52AC|nr:TolC family protein [Dokdonia sp. Hel_I_53]TVZ53126.1 outer membrane protein TolC [Dokdonia sp. Hel_I_53]
MKLFLKILCVATFFAFAKAIIAQENPIVPENVISFEEYIGFVKKHHPLIKQAELVLTAGEANLLKARGGFDPKVELDYDRKKFKGTTYYDQLYTAFKIPTWYGVELKGTFEENTGQFLNPNLTVPEDGLYSAGVSFALAQGLLINERMATLKKAKFFQQQSIADRRLLINKILYEASLAYFNWLKNENEKIIYTSFLSNAQTRLNAVTRSVNEGDKARIDITEARIVLENRKLALEAASLKATKSRLEVSNYIWLDGLPLEINDNTQPQIPTPTSLNNSLSIAGLTDTNAILIEHPKLESLTAKINSLEVERFLKKNKLLPKVNIQYNFLTPEVDTFDNLNTSNYKAFVDVSFPLFLRKERGDLQLAALKVKDANFERTATTLAIKNKLTATEAEINSLSIQNTYISNIINDYETLVVAEERKFFLGESSLFLINTREQKLIDARLKGNSLTVESLKAVAKLYNVAGL